MDKVYLVIEYGGEYEESWTSPVWAYPSLDLAEKAKFEINNLHNSHKISGEMLDSMLLKLDNYENDNDIELSDDEVKSLSILFPEYDIEDIKAAYDDYNSDWRGTYIKEIPFYDGNNN